MSSVDVSELDTIFGRVPGRTPEERARNSACEFVRSLDQITEATDRAKGRRLTAVEALEAYGLEILREVATEGSALLSYGPKAAGRLVRNQRELLGLEVRHVANAARVPPQTVLQLEAHQRVPIREVERIARVLALDERIVSWKAEAPRGHHEVAVRLRTTGEEVPLLTHAAVAAIAEAAWVASTQARLQRHLGLAPSLHGIEPSPNYGGPGYPPFMHGYYLAGEARQALELGSDRLPRSLREIAEDRLGIPVIQAEMGTGIAGATVEVTTDRAEAGTDRAVVVNLDGANRSVFVRRTTIAHELGHLLYDPANRLESLRVDDYTQLDRAPHELPDPVEQRANAFGVEFIAPQAAVVARFHSAADDGLWAVMNHFGISQTAARYQIWNGLERSVPLNTIRVSPGKRPDPVWEAGEEYTVAYHPLQGLRPSRAGRFSAVVVRAAEEGLISRDTAAEMLEVDPGQIPDAVPAIRDLFPSVFAD